MNIIINKTIILDVKYYITGKLNIVKFLFSIPIMTIEELAFRLPIIFDNASHLSCWSYLIISSFTFGSVHIFFSKQDLVSKTILGFILGFTMIETQNIIFSIVLHLFYNFLACRPYQMRGK
ncbi:CPBP family intramembrane metalloprotease [Enterococcus sp. MSG2901]|uniref:CPBP family intramembrane metalloprotease n=1 Tax=Candidatus Enterococcus courvalinii TaxID=2815329 RepID=A0ABS3HXR2_9ENTE|nr:CPBP family intramembrane metalloprotease [Enterococcus sp. MSG2901]